MGTSRSGSVFSIVASQWMNSAHSIVPLEKKKWVLRVTSPSFQHWWKPPRKQAQGRSGGRKFWKSGSPKRQWASDEIIIPCLFRLQSSNNKEWQTKKNQGDIDRRLKHLTMLCCEITSQSSVKGEKIAEMKGERISHSLGSGVGGKNLFISSPSWLGAEVKGGDRGMFLLHFTRVIAGPRKAEKAPRSIGISLWFSTAALLHEHPGSMTGKGRVAAVMVGYKYCQTTHSGIHMTDDYHKGEMMLWGLRVHGTHSVYEKKGEAGREGVVTSSF